VCDLGTSSCKFGFAGNVEPQLTIPSYLAAAESKNSLPGTFELNGLEDLTSHIGLDVKTMKHLNPVPFMEHGIISNFDLFTAFMNQVPYTVLSYDTRRTPLLITEPVNNSPEHRERIGEILFDTLDYPAVCLMKQPIASILSALFENKNGNLTGLVVDSGDGSTQITPVYEGFPILSQVVQIPLAGKDVTKYITSILREREQIPANYAFEIATMHKEANCYLCSDPVKEFAKYDKDPEKFFIDCEFTCSDGKAYKFKAGHERFMSAEFFFNPDILNQDYKKSLIDNIIETVGRCPIDSRRGLFANIVVSGGSTTFKNFDRRLQADLKAELDRRRAEQIRINPRSNPKPIEVNVPKDKYQMYRVFKGASVYAIQDFFPQMLVYKDAYNEHGKSIFRRNNKVLG